jgi:WD40 repeat protein
MRRGEGKAMLDRPGQEVGPVAKEDTSVERPRGLRLPLLVVIQFAAMIVFSASLGLALATSHSPGPLVFSSDGRTLVGAVNGYSQPAPDNALAMHGVIKAWDSETGKTLARLSGPGTWLRALAICPDGSILAVAGDTPSIELWDFARGTRVGVLAGHAADVTGVAFAPSGKLLASASVDGEIRLWDVATRRTRITLRVDQYGAHGLTFAPDGSRLAACDANGVRFWDVADGRLVGEIPGQRLGFLGFSPDARDGLLARYAGRHGEVATVLDGATRAERFVIRWCRSHALSPDGRRMAVGDRSGNVWILDASSGRTLLKPEGLRSEVRGLAFSTDGRWLAGGDEGGQLCVWEAGTGRLRTSFPAGDPIRRWGLAATTLVIWAVTMICSLRRS